MQNPKTRALFGGPFPCMALVGEVRVVCVIDLAHLVLAIRPKHALTFHQYILFLKRLLSISEPKT